MAVCDVDRQAREATAKRFAIPRAYADAGRMLEDEKIDVLYSLVRAADRTDVEARAAAQGIHLFSEKPQALSMKVARAIDTAVRRAGVLSTVGFRERYRPLFREARRLLAGRRIIHVNFLSEGTTGARDPARLRSGRRRSRRGTRQLREHGREWARLGSARARLRPLPHRLERRDGAGLLPPSARLPAAACPTATTSA